MKLYSSLAIALGVLLAPLVMAQANQAPPKPTPSEVKTPSSNSDASPKKLDEISTNLVKLSRDLDDLANQVRANFRDAKGDAKEQLALIQKRLDDVRTAYAQANGGRASAADSAKLDGIVSDLAALKKSITSLEKKAEPISEWVIWGVPTVFTFIILLVVVLYVRDRTPQKDVKNPFSVNPKEVAEEVMKGLNERLSAQAKTQDLVRPIAEIKAILNSMQQTLPQVAGKAAAEEVSKSQVGDLKEKLVALQSQFDAAAAQAATSQQATERANAAAIDADRAKHQAVTERDAALDSLRHTEATVAQLRQELDSKERHIQQASEDVQSAQKLSLAAQNEVKRTLEVNVPPGISDPMVVAQMQALHREAIQGSAPAVIAWATLCSFSAADVDPSSKDFLLHALKRLGSVLVNYWKAQEGSTAKDRHEKLAHWAKCLSELAQGRFSLIVPPLGSPVNKAAMSSAGSATTVQEVLTWQVRNPAGATFSLAEIA